MIWVKGGRICEILSPKYSSIATSGAFEGSSFTLASIEQTCVVRASNVGHSGLGDRCSNFSVASSIIVSRNVKAASGFFFWSFRRFHVSGRFVRSIDLVPFGCSCASRSFMFVVVIIPRMWCLWIGLENLTDCFR